MQLNLGILGVGHLASYVVAGLRRADKNRSIYLSPRNHDHGLRLSKEFNCEQLSSNQCVVDRSELILLSVRPNDVVSLLSNLSFSSKHIVISCVAGLSIKDIESLVHPAKVVRTLPLASSEVGEGVVPLYPENELVASLLKPLGKLVTFKTENAFEVSAVASCMNGWIYGFISEIAQWFVSRGVDEQEANELVVHTLLGASKLAAYKADKTSLEIFESIATEGTYTKSGWDVLTENDQFSNWKLALDSVESSLAGKE